MLNIEKFMITTKEEEWKTLFEVYNQYVANNICTS